MSKTRNSLNVGNSFLRAFLLVVTLVGVFVGCGGGGSTDQTLASRSGSSGAPVRINGSEVFPIGFYYVSHYSEQKQQRFLDLEKIASAGFKFIHTPIDGADGEFLDRCAELGVSVIAENNHHTPDELVESFRDHPAIVAWSTFDDVDEAAGFATLKNPPETVLAAHADLEQRDPNALTYISAGNAQRYKSFIGLSDLLGVQIYPVPDEPLSATYHFLSRVKQSIGGAEQKLIGNLQTFPWHGKKRIPNAAEARNMTYQALLAGVQGILYYAYLDPNVNLNERPDLWSELVELRNELTSIESYLLYGSYQKLRGSSATVLAGSWEYQGEILVIVVNTASSPAEGVSFQFPWNGASGVRSYSSDLPSKLRIGSGTLSVDMQGQEVQVGHIAIG